MVLAIQMQIVSLEELQHVMSQLEALRKLEATIDGQLLPMIETTEILKGAAGRLSRGSAEFEPATRSDQVAEGGSVSFEHRCCRASVMRQHPAFCGGHRSTHTSMCRVKATSHAT